MAHDWFLITMGIWESQETSKRCHHCRAEPGPSTTIAAIPRPSPMGIAVAGRRAPRPMARGAWRVARGPWCPGRHDTTGSPSSTHWGKAPRDGPGKRRMAPGPMCPVGHRGQVIDDWQKTACLDAWSVLAVIRSLGACSCSCQSVRPRPCHMRCCSRRKGWGGCKGSADCPHALWALGSGLCGNYEDVRTRAPYCPKGSISLEFVCTNEGKAEVCQQERSLGSGIARAPVKRAPEVHTVSGLAVPCLARPCSPAIHSPQARRPHSLLRLAMGGG
jgi:hypothetical protein